MTTPTAEPRSIVVVTAGVSDPSSTTLLANRLAQKSIDLLGGRGIRAEVSTIELPALIEEIGKASVVGFVGEELQGAIDRLARADAVIAATPVYKADVSGLFKSFLDVLDNDLLIAKPVALVATAGTSRHALVPDERMRPLFAYLRALALPTSVFATPEDWGAGELGERIERAATELAVLLRAGVGREIAERNWAAHQHEFAGNATRAERGGEDLDFDSPLMRLAAGGSLADG
jgi:FMN reductase